MAAGFFFILFYFSGSRPDPGRLASSRPDQVITKHGRSNKVTGRPLITTRGQGVNSGQSEVLFYVGSGTQLVSPFCCFFFPPVLGKRKILWWSDPLEKKEKFVRKQKYFSSSAAAAAIYFGSIRPPNGQLTILQDKHTPPLCVALNSHQVALRKTRKFQLRRWIERTRPVSQLADFSPAPCAQVMSPFQSHCMHWDPKFSLPGLAIRSVN